MVKRPGTNDKLASLIDSEVRDFKTIGMEETEESLKLKEGEEIVYQIPLNQIKEVSNVRKTYTEESILEMAASVKIHGVLQPIYLYERGPEDYVIIFGHRRYLGSKRANATKIPAIITKVMPKNITEKQLIENLLRVDLNSVECGDAVFILNQTMSAREIAKTLGKSEGWVSRQLSGREIRVKYATVLKEHNAEEISSIVLAEIASLPDDDQEKALVEALEAGGKRDTFRAVVKNAVVKDKVVKPQELSLTIKITMIDSGATVVPTIKGDFSEETKNHIVAACKEIMDSFTKGGD